MTTSVPNTPSELLQQNRETTPEEIWERVTDLSPSDLQVFGWNVMNRLREFHQSVVKEMITDEDTDPETLIYWVKDLTIYSSVCDQLKKVSD